MLTHTPQGTPGHRDRPGVWHPASATGTIVSIVDSVAHSASRTLAQAGEWTWKHHSDIGLAAMGVGTAAAFPLAARSGASRAGVQLLQSSGKLGAAGRMASTGSRAARSGAKTLYAPFDAFKGLRLAAGTRSNGVIRPTTLASEKLGKAGMTVGTGAAAMNFADVVRRRAQGTASNVDLGLAGAFMIPGIAAGTKAVAGAAQAAPAGRATRLSQVKTAASKVESGVGQANTVAAVPYNANTIANQSTHRDTSKQQSGIGLSLAKFLLGRTGKMA